MPIIQHWKMIDGDRERAFLGTKGVCGLSTMIDWRFDIFLWKYFQSMG